MMFTLKIYTQRLCFGVSVEVEVVLLYQIILLIVVETDADDAEPKWNVFVSHSPFEESYKFR
jgi:hypothetical protein